MRFNFLLPVLAAAFSFGQVRLAAANAATATSELLAVAPVAVPRRRAPLWLLLGNTCGGDQANPNRYRWNQRKLRKRARRAASAGLGRMAFA